MADHSQFAHDMILEMYGDLNKVTFTEEQMLVCVQLCRAIVLAKVEHPEDEDVMWEDLGMLLLKYSEDADVIKQPTVQ